MTVSGKVGRFKFSVSLGERGGDARTPHDEAAPWHVLIVADVSGRGARGSLEQIGSRRPQRLDVDNLDAAFSSFRARVSLPASVTGGADGALEPRTLDDLHPDQLLQTVPGLSELSSAKRALPSDPSAASRLTELLGQPRGPAAGDGPDSEPPSGVRESGESSQQTLSRLLGASPGETGVHRAAPAAPPQFDVDRLVRSLIGGLTGMPAPPEDTTALAAAADHTLGERLRSVLSAPGFRRLESVWRGIDGLLRTCPDSERIRYSVFDATLEELAADRTGLARLLDGGYSLLLLDHACRADAGDLEGLGMVLRACAARGLPVVTGANAELAGCPGFDRAPDPEQWLRHWPSSVHAAWDDLTRQREAGAELALALPRFLSRQPYGSSGETLESLRFEEILDSSQHEAFPWSNGAYLVARALAELWASDGERAHADGSVDLRELPVVHLEAEDGIRIEPCAEAWLSDRAVGRLLASGFAVLQGLRDSDRVRVHL